MDRLRGRRVMPAEAKQRKGNIRIELEQEDGPTFEVVRHHAVHAPAAKLPQLVDFPKSRRAPTILFVEDETSIRELVAGYLERVGCRVIEASDARQAIAQWEQHGCDIDLVVTDLILPGGVNGRELIQHLKADRPALKVILVSGYTSDSFGEELFLDRTTSFLQKPYRLKNLADIVHNCLQQEDEPRGIMSSAAGSGRSN